LVINHQGQLISLPVLQAASNQNTSSQSGAQQTVNLSQINFASLANTNQIQNSSSAQLQATISAVASGATQTRVNTSNNNTNNNNNNNGTTPIKTLLEEDEKSDTNSIDDQGPTIANMPTSNLTAPGHSHGAHITHATTVDGVNLDEIREFAKAFKLRRLALGLTQTQVGQALSATKGPAYSQSAICRFEKLDITPKSAAKIKPVLEKWMQEAELKYADRLKTGSHQNFADLLGTENTKKRKRRTSFTPQALEILNEYFEKNTHPSGNQGADMTMLAQKLNYDREVIRVWFCNKRQALKNTLKKLKQSNESGGLDISSDQSESESPISSQHQQSSQQLIVSPTIQLNSNTTSNVTQTQSTSIVSMPVISVVSTHANSNQLEQSDINSAASSTNGSSSVSVLLNTNANTSPTNPSTSPTKTVITLTNPEQKTENVNNSQASTINNCNNGNNNANNNSNNSNQNANSSVNEDLNLTAQNTSDAN
jgi:class 6 POU domain transcription factor